MFTKVIRIFGNTKKTPVLLNKSTITNDRSSNIESGIIASEAFKRSHELMDRHSDVKVADEQKPKIEENTVHILDKHSDVKVADKQKPKIEENTVHILDNSSKVNLIVSELLNAEQIYIKDLARGIDEYNYCYYANSKPNSHKNEIIANIQDIKNFHEKTFYPSLQRCDVNVMKICETFCRLVQDDSFYIYVKYAIISKRAMKRNRSFCADDQNLTKVRLDIKSFLMQPIQRLPRYLLLLRELIKELGNLLDVVGVKESITSCCRATESLQRLMDQVNGIEDNEEMNDLGTNVSVDLPNQLDRDSGNSVVLMQNTNGNRDSKSTVSKAIKRILISDQKFFEILSALESVLIPYTTNSQPNTFMKKFMKSIQTIIEYHENQHLSKLRDKTHSTINDLCAAFRCSLADPKFQIAYQEYAALCTIAMRPYDIHSQEKRLISPLDHLQIQYTHLENLQSELRDTDSVELIAVAKVATLLLQFKSLVSDNFKLSSIKGIHICFLDEMGLVEYSESVSIKGGRNRLLSLEGGLVCVETLLTTKTQCEIFTKVIFALRTKSVRIREVKKKPSRIRLYADHATYNVDFATVTGLLRFLRGERDRSAK